MNSSSNRKSSTHNQDILFFSEAEGFCPKCGKQLFVRKNKNLIKKYEIAHIYPCNPTEKDLSILTDVQEPEDRESFNNKIALCLDCHKIYDSAKTIQEYRNLRNIKDKLIENKSIDELIEKYPIEEDINSILTKLINLNEKTNLCELRMDALKIKDKIENKFNLLRIDIENKVTKYYLLIQKMLKETGTDAFDIIALQVKTFYKDCSTKTDDKNIIFEKMIKWLQVKTGSKNKIACAVIISFFVQNCEVFDEISK